MAYDSETQLHTPGLFNSVIHNRTSAVRREIVAHLFNYILTGNYAYCELAFHACRYSNSNYDFLDWAKEWLRGAGNVNWK